MKWEDKLEDILTANGAIEDLRELLIKQAYQNETLQNTFTPMYNTKNGKHLGWVGDMSDVGWAGAKCDPTYQTPTVQVAEKVWAMGLWSVPLTFCFEQYRNTIAEYALKKGTDMDDLDGTLIAQILISDPLTAALTKMYWRMVWFGDTQGANLTSGVEPTLFTMTDGLWKQLIAVATESTSQRVTIAANEAETAAAQKAAIKEEGVAVGIFDNLIENADPRIASMSGAGIFCTKSLKDALTHDLKVKYHIQLTWQQITGGVEIGEYNGVKVTAISVWDRLIQEYFNNGTKLNLPHRAFFGSTSQLFVGTPANDIVSDVDAFRDRKARTWNYYIAGELGTLVGQDDLFQIAY